MAKAWVRNSGLGAWAGKPSFSAVIHHVMNLSPQCRRLSVRQAPAFTGCTLNYRPKAFITFMTVDRLGFPSLDSAL